MKRSPSFLETEWRDLAILNFVVDGSILAPLVPNGVELDLWENRAYVSLVGLLFVNTKVLGVSIPFHRCFEAVNCRFYVRRQATDGWRRGVVFIKGLVPRISVALVARALYNEPYVALPMRHRIESSGRQRDPVRVVTYEWTFNGDSNHLFLAARPDPSPIREGSQEEFFAERYWGYCIQRDGATLEYHVERPRWWAAPAVDAGLSCDVAGLYGSRFADALRDRPASAFLVEGSHARVSRGKRVA